ncbi:M50 family metallopeptidase [Haliangium sp.]|uniref:M50 family metallopeptidase n=1 Tax=Haliangium sp. TaxID=2663208 RepID=UPI003D0D0C10
MLGYLAAILVGIVPLILVHEAGHYLVAKWCKMRVDRFSIGFGPALARWERNGTEFKLSPILFGGYAEIRGMNVVEEVDRDDIYAYPNRPAWQRFLAIFAGPGANYVFAIVLAAFLFSVAGVESGTVWINVGEVSDGFDARGKLEPGDRIVSIQRAGDAEPVAVYFALEGEPSPYSLGQMVHDSKGAPMTVTVLRDGQELSFDIAARADANLTDPATGEPLYRLGIILSGEAERVDVGVVNALGHAIVFPWQVTREALGGLYDAIFGEAEVELTGPVGIAIAVKESLTQGWIRAIQMLVLLNVLIGLFNLLPVPALDGGRLVFLVYEMATRRRANPKIEATVHMVGIMLLLMVLVAVTFKDIRNAIIQR